MDTWNTTSDACKKQHFVDLIQHSSKFEYNSQLTTQELLNNRCEIVQTGIGDLYFAVILMNDGEISSPVYFNVAFYVKNPNSVGNPAKDMEVKLKLLNTIAHPNDVVFFYDERISYSNWQAKITDIRHLSFLQERVHLERDASLPDEYIVIQTKCRATSDFDYQGMKTRLREFCRYFKTDLPIVIEGEQMFPYNLETAVHGITTVYDELMELKANNQVIDRTTYNIYNDLDYDRILHFLGVLHHAKYSITLGSGGNFVSSICFAKNTIALSREDLLLIRNRDTYAKNNVELFLDIGAFLQRISRLT